MSVYPPLTEAQLRTIQQHVNSLYELKREVVEQGLHLVMDPGDEDILARAIAEMRQKVQRLDLELFRTFGLVHRLHESNVSTSLPQPRVRPTTDSLLELLK